MLGALLARSRLPSISLYHHVRQGTATVAYATNCKTFGGLPAFTNTFAFICKPLCRAGQHVGFFRRQFYQSAINKQAKQMPRKRSKLLPFEVDSKVASDVVIYTFVSDRFYKMVTVFGVVQFLLWINIAYFTYTTPALINKHGQQPFPEGSWWAMIARVQTNFKTHLAFTCMCLAYLLLYFTYLYPQRTISKLTLLRGGENIRVTTYSHFGLKKHFEVPVDDLSFRQTRQATGSSLYVKVKGRWFYYMMDKRDGKFHNHELFDYAVGLQRTLKKK